MMNQKISLNGFSLNFILLSFLILIVYLGFIPTQGEFFKIILPYIGAFTIYSLIVFRFEIDKYFTALILTGIICRVVLIFAFPNLSDDIYRFLWDAELIVDGKNPYLYLPENIVTLENQALFDKLNSKGYYSPYPPVSQLVYVLAATLSASKLYAFSIIIKVLTVTAELGTLYYILKILDILHLAKQRILIYWLNPLILVELVGNLHFESFMIFFMMASVYYLLQNKIMYGAVAFTLAVASKLLPLMFGPFLLAYLGFKKSNKFVLISGISFLLLFIPIIIGIINGTFLSSVGLYFQKFEFNASTYYFLREIGYSLYGWNIIGTLGPTLGIFTLMSICMVWYLNRRSITQKNIFEFLLFAISLYLFTSTTIHPWYIALPLAFCLFTDFRYPILWSGLIFLTYINYSYDSYHENLMIVGIEYSLVLGLLIYELKRYRIKKASLN